MWAKYFFLQIFFCRTIIRMLFARKKIWLGKIYLCQKIVFKEKLGFSVRTVCSGFYECKIFFLQIFVMELSSINYRHNIIQKKKNN